MMEKTNNGVGKKKQKQDKTEKNVSYVPAILKSLLLELESLDSVSKKNTLK